MSTGALLLSFTVVRNAVTTGIYSCCCIPVTFGKPAEAYHRWGVGKCQELDVLLSLGCCSGQFPHMGCWKQEGLGTDPPRAACKAGMPGGGITQGHLHWLSSQPAHSGLWGDLQVPGNHLHCFLPLCYFLFKDHTWQQISSGGQSPLSWFFLA